MTDSNPSLEERVDELEIRLAHQDRLIEELNEVITRQQDRMDRLVRDLRRITEALHGISGPTEGGEDAPPPHY